MAETRLRCMMLFIAACRWWRPWPHHRLTALMYLYMRACKCQLFTDEDSWRLPKRLNYCFSALASAVNQLIHSTMSCGLMSQ